VKYERRTPGKNQSKWPETAGYSGLAANPLEVMVTLRPARRRSLRRQAPLRAHSAPLHRDTRDQLIVAKAQRVVSRRNHTF
jgi:hypothetical protein